MRCAFLYDPYKSPPVRMFTGTEEMLQVNAETYLNDDFGLGDVIYFFVDVSTDSI